MPTKINNNTADVQDETGRTILVSLDRVYYSDAYKSWVRFVQYKNGKSIDYWVPQFQQIGLATARIKKYAN